MKKVLKILGITAAVAALTPYRIHKDKETGEKKVEALLWRATAAPKDGEEKMTLGFQSPFASKSEEPLFEEEPVAEFEVTEETGGEAEEAAEEAAEAEVEAVKAAAEEAAPEEVQQETPAE